MVDSAAFVTGRGQRRIMLSTNEARRVLEEAGRARLAISTFGRDVNWK